MTPPSAPAPRPGRGAARTAVMCALLAGLAVALRSLQRALVLNPDAVLPVDPDAFYHFRRIAWTVRNFPAFLSFDPYVRFPHGGEPIWSPPFDFALAALVRAVLGDAGQDAMERLLCWVPPLLGALHVVLLFLLARRFLSTPAAFAAGLLLAVLPGHVAYSQVGFLDHHVAVSLAGTFVLFAALAFAADPGRVQAALVGLAFAGALLLWPGSLIHVGVAQAALLGLCVSRGERDEAVRVARRLAAAHAIAAVAVAPLSLGRTWLRWGAFSPLVLSNFQPFWLALGAASCALLALAWRRVGFPRGAGGRLAAAAGIGAAVLGVVLLALPELATNAAADAFAWLARREEFQAVVKESQPMLLRRGRIDVWRCLVQLSGAVLVAPVAIALVLRRARAERRPELAILGAWSAAFVGLALAQFRFGIDAAPALALLLPAAVDAPRGPLAPGRSRRRIALLAALGLVLCLPILEWYALHPLSARVRARRAALTVDAARWLREHSPRTEGWLAPGPPPAYGVLGPWAAGHALRYRAERPVVQDNFGDDVGHEGFAAAGAYYAAEDEAEAVEILGALRVRYVLSGPTGSGHGHAYTPASMHARLRASGGATAATDGAAAGESDPLVYHRLVYESEAFDPRGSEPHWRLFEVVPGARLVGAAAPGSAVEAALWLRTRRGRALRFVARARADAAGRYALTLPYPTGAGGDVVSASRYALRSGDARGAVSVSEAQVRGGEEVRAPRLLAPAAAPGAGRR